MVLLCCSNLSQLVRTSNISPIVYYYLGYFSEKLGDAVKASEISKACRTTVTWICVPFPVWSHSCTSKCIGSESKMHGRLIILATCIWLAAWEVNSIMGDILRLRPGSQLMRNLAIATLTNMVRIRSRKHYQPGESCSVGQPYPTHFAELDRLYQAAGTSVQKRLHYLRRIRILYQERWSFGFLIISRHLQVRLMNQ